MNIKKAFGLLLTVTLSSTFAAPSYAKSPLWKVSKGSDHLYIGGTIHLLKSSDYPLPSAFSDAYKKSAKIVFETDLQKSQTAEFQSLVIQKVTYKNGDTLENHLKPATYKKLTQYLEKNNFPLALVNNFKPGMAMTMLTVMELKKLGITGEGVDKFFNAKAVSDQKTLGKLETINDQVDFIANIGSKSPDEFIIYSLKDLKKIAENFAKIKAAWREGDLKALTDTGITPMKEQFPATYESLIVKRNKAWVPQIKKMLETKEIEMVLVGTLHLAGSDSVLNQLKADGFTIEQL